MSIKVALRHHTHYSYDRLVKLYPQVIRLRPAPHARSPIEAYSLKISPEPHFLNWQQDPFGNYQARVVFPEKADHFTIDVEVLVELVSINPFDFFLEEFAEQVPFAYPAALEQELMPYLEIKERGPRLMKWVEKARELEGGSTVDFLVKINQLINQEVAYTVRMEPGVQTCEHTLEKALGSCRDSAWLLVQLFRHLGLAARFVSGYLVQLVADEKPVEGPTGTDKDFTDLHAWAEIYLPGAGWVGLDATSGLLAGEGHIPLACTPDPRSAAPITGATEPCQVSFEFANVVERIWEKPRVTKPYQPEQWQRILALGDQVEQALQAGDVRLTMGGEPTFVSALDMESSQWNEDADGDDKRSMGYDLALRLKDQFAPQGFLHLGQGKWYPGEPIPRWQYALYWRKDGQPIWQDARWQGDPRQRYDHDETHAKKFIQQLAPTLGIHPHAVRAAHEDVFYFLWEEGNLPVNQELGEINFKDKLERQTLAQLIDRGLGRPAGYVLPLQWDGEAGRWQSCLWELRREALFLIPGNSAMGLRLPLDRLPNESAEAEQVQVELSPLAERGPLPPQGKSKEEAPLEPPKGPTIKMALCVEAREGRLYVFMPPIKLMEAYLDLVSCLEQVAQRLEMPIIIEGYQPSFDPRMEKLAVTPDPGVIEVNVHPAQQWRDLVQNYETLFEQARLARLGTEKFMLDGKHTGTGGGNHVTLGGQTPADSPFLRRPDLLRSFVNFWQNHPGLSYLFASAFVGPTSQAPRVDEGRPEMLYELEIAFAELDRHENPPHWLVDRLFRNLLIDVTGNTHRAEFCIDKLYSPDSLSGRLGIVEMRGFDMPPHREMCLSQILLIRALTAAFWQKPYRQKLVRWGTELHDKFLIHHFVKEDLTDVCDYLAEQGFQFELSWLDPFFEFRFPILGQVQVGSLHLTLRAGIEPWNVLGEELSNTGTARFVDSSVERVEVKVSGFNPERYALLCNQTQIPLVSTGRKGEYVSGIRYKAWNPPSALHPTVGTDVPLVFDLYDRWNERSVGGCTYYVSHPGGRSYDTFPVNSYEAESRRVNRFWEFNHTPRAVEQIVNQDLSPTSVGRYVSETYQPTQGIAVKAAPPNLDFPHTLDLRRGE
ncbi:MAG: transglutaminase family protein [Bacteroidota bacterium]